MTAREKAVKGLELCIENTHKSCPLECPYLIECLIQKPVFLPVMRDALAVLRQQEPVKPKKDDAWPYPISVCGVCGTCLFKVGDYKPKFCSECGRAVEWDD